jgi:hypothetical protein
MNIIHEPKHEEAAQSAHASSQISATVLAAQSMSK